jgi:hypothetical protein
MEDPKLENDIAQVKELINIWQSYYRLLLSAFDREKKLPANADDEFQKIKTVVAQRHDHFSSVIQKDFFVAQNILQMVKRTISIHDFSKASEVALDKTLIEWHEANILLFETLGSLEYKKFALSKVSESEHKKEQTRRERQAKIDKIRNNPGLYMAIKFISITTAILVFWYSPLSTAVGNIGFVKSRINDFRQIFGMTTDEDEQKPGSTGKEKEGDKPAGQGH